jgi:DNA-binding response OmpR family regulator
MLAEDDSILGSALQVSLTRAGFAVDWVQKGTDFSASVTNHQYDFVILDLTLPDASGDVLLPWLRNKHPRMPVIVVSARSGVHDRVQLLNLGADDYLVKPFDLDELTARIRSVQRRWTTSDDQADNLSYGPLQLDPLRHSATWHGNPVSLTRREFCVLEILVRRKNQVLTRAQFEDALYGWGEEVESNTVEVYVHFLRRKFHSALIHTIRGVGYQLAPLQ